MLKLSKIIKKVLENYDFSIRGEITEWCNEKGKYDIELETCSPEGEDVVVSLIYDGTDEGFIAAFIEYANYFDAEEHAEMWIKSRGKNGVPESIKDLLEDAEWQKNTFLEVAKTLNNINGKSEKKENEFDKDGFMHWLKEKFPEILNTHWNWELVERIIDYAIKYKNISKDQLSYFISDILPEVEFLEVAKFCHKSFLTDGTLNQLGRI